MKVVIIGAVAAGPKAACRIKRLCPQAEVIMIDKDNIISYGACGIPYLISGDVPSIEELYSTNFHVLRSPEYFENFKGVKVLTQTEALHIDRKQKVVTVRHLQTGQQSVINYDKLVLATGSTPFVPPIAGIDAPNVVAITNIHDAQKVHELITKGEVERAVIIGGGAIGIEMAEALTDMWGIEVTIIELMPQLLPQILDYDLALMVQNQLTTHDVKVYCQTRVTEIKKDKDGKAQSVITDKGEFPADLIILATGVRPNTKLAQEAGLLVSPQGIVVNKRLQTSDPDIYAGGDCVQNWCLITGKGVFMSSGSIANRHGRVIADNIAGRAETFDGVVRSFTMKAFDLCVAKTGLSLETAQKEGFDVLPVMVVQLDRAHFYPTKQLIYLQLTVERSGRLLGAQALGLNGDAVVGKINTLAGLLRKQANIYDLIGLEVAYTPPFGAAMDILNTAGNVAQNTLEGKNRSVGISEFLELWAQKEKYLFLDIREAADAKPFVERFAPYWINISQGEIKKRLKELPSDKKIIVICNTGMRSYEVQLLLDAAGLKNNIILRGGMAALKMAGIDLLQKD